MHMTRSNRPSVRRPPQVVIGEENGRLVKRIGEITTRGHKTRDSVSPMKFWLQQLPVTSPAYVAPATTFRRKKAEHDTLENLRLHQRLATVSPRAPFLCWRCCGGVRRAPVPVVERQNASAVHDGMSCGGTLPSGLRDRCSCSTHFLHSSVVAGTQSLCNKQQKRDASIGCTLLARLSL